MAYTQTDLDNIDQAILDYALGNRKDKVVIGAHVVEFADVSIDQLQNLRAVVAASVSTSFSPRSVSRNGGRG